jgi:hypothetical protein
MPSSVALGAPLATRPPPPTCGAWAAARAIRGPFIVAVRARFGHFVQRLARAAEAHPAGLCPYDFAYDRRVPLSSIKTPHRLQSDLFHQEQPLPPPANRQSRRRPIVQERPWPTNSRRQARLRTVFVADFPGVAAAARRTPSRRAALDRAAADCTFFRRAFSRRRCLRCRKARCAAQAIRGAPGCAPAWVGRSEG